MSGAIPPPTVAEFDRWWRGGAIADSDCPSCYGTGWATIRTGGITFAGGRCRCIVGEGGVWAVEQNTESEQA